jgi:hypothetical protein
MFRTIRILVIAFWGIPSLSLIAGPVIVVDPGHGGPGAWKYGANGDEQGAVGQNGLTEEWVNLYVAQQVVNFMWQSWPDANVILTRDCDTCYRALWARVQRAKDAGSKYFLSIHHQSSEFHDVQGTEVWWSSRLHDDSSNVRNDSARDSSYAKKVLLRILGAWGDSLYKNRCRTKNLGQWMQGCDELRMNNPRITVVRNINHLCYAALSEASFIDIYSEEALFASTPSLHAALEAWGIGSGTHSHYFNAGFARISNKFLPDDGYHFHVDDVYLSSPTEMCWEGGENHDLSAEPGFWLDGYSYQFHHWAHLDGNNPDPRYPLQVYYNSNVTISVPYTEPFHIYRAYFNGGPYFCNVYEPLGSGIYGIGDTMQIQYTCDVGVDSTSLVDVYLDRHNGHSGFTDMIALNVPYADGVRWVINGPESDSCLMKVVAHDFVGNSASDTLRYTFKVKCASCGDADNSGSIGIEDAVYIIAYIFSGGPTPGDCNYPMGLGDANGDGDLDISDAVYLTAYIFSGGAAPHCL